MINTPKSTKIGIFTGSSTTTAIGFDLSEATPDVYTADFVNGVYKVNNVDSTFNNIFSFSRAGKAWLVKNNALVEYEVDVPRFDNGLLIEQSATNYAAWSFLPENGSYVKGGIVFSSGHWVYDAVTSGTVFQYPQPYPDLSSGNRIFSTHGVNGRFINMRTGTSVNTTLSQSGFRDYYIKTDQDTVNISGLLYPKIVSQYALYYQVEGLNTQQLPTSPIKTTTAAVTRPADFLSLKFITGSSLTGDWDSTLSLSLVNGQIQRTGYGRIRSLEVR